MYETKNCQLTIVNIQCKLFVTQSVKGIIVIEK